MNTNKPISAFTSKYAQRVNVLMTDILASESVLTNTNPQVHTFNAIWDTGATGTCITSKVAEELGLTPITMTKVNTAAGESTANVYLIDVMLPERSVTFSQVKVSEVELAGADFLIGMDIIGLGDFSISTNPKGGTTFSYRVPSCGEVDYVAMISAQNLRDKVKRPPQSANKKRSKRK